MDRVVYNCGMLFFLKKKKKKRKKKTDYTRFTTQGYYISKDFRLFPGEKKIK